MKRWILTVIAVLATVLALGAAAGAVAPDQDRGGRPGPMMGGPMMGGSETQGWGMPGSWMSGAMMPGMRIGSERAWLTEMVAHHQEAVLAAGELARSDREEMRDFGAAIVEDQSAQVELMQGWLEEWYGGPAPGVRYRPMMRDLTGLSGNRLDRVFLQDMTVHHMMAVMMSQQLLARGLAEHQEVADLAVEIRDAQRQEIVQMQQWLARRFPGAKGRCPMGMMSGGASGHMMRGPMMG